MDMAESLFHSAVRARQSFMDKYALDTNEIDISAVFDGEESFTDLEGNLVEVEYIMVTIAESGVEKSGYACRLYTRVDKTGGIRGNYTTFVLTDGAPHHHPMDDLVLLEFLRDDQELGLNKALDNHREWGIKLGISKAENQV